MFLKSLNKTPIALHRNQSPTIRQPNRTRIRGLTVLKMRSSIGHRQVLFVGIVLIAASIHSCAGKLPSIIKPCSRHHPHIEQCIIAAVEDLRPLLLHGDLGDGFQTLPLDPMRLDNLQLGREGSNFVATNTNVKLRGVGSFVVDKMRVDVNGPHVNMTVTLPRIDYRSDYTMRVQVLLLRLQGSGKLRSRFAGTRIKFRMVGERVQRAGVEYVRFKDINVRVKFQPGATLELEQTSPGGELAARFARENTQLILDELTPTLETNLSHQFYRIVNKIFADVTFAELFPDVPA